MSKTTTTLEKESKVQGLTFVKNVRKSRALPFVEPFRNSTQNLSLDLENLKSRERERGEREGSRREGSWGGVI